MQQKTWRKEKLDMVLVPVSLLIMFGYHLFLLYRYLRLPKTTVIGYENYNKRAWVERMMQIDAKDRGLAISVIANNISAASSMASVALVLSSLIVAWLGSESRTVFTSSLVYGDTSSSIISIKYVALLICFLAAFCAFVQTARCFVHANFLISMPNSDIPVTCVQKEVIRRSNIWEIGMRASYFATTLLLWVFGPIPMFVSSVFMVGLLQNLDRNTLPLHLYQPVGLDFLSKETNAGSKFAKHPEKPTREGEEKARIS